MIPDLSTSTLTLVDRVGSPRFCKARSSCHFGSSAIEPSNPSRRASATTVLDSTSRSGLGWWIASTARFLDAVSARPDFEERYRLNPEKAMVEYLPLAASLTRPTFNLQVSRAGLMTYFTPLP